MVIIMDVERVVVVGNEENEMGKRISSGGGHQGIRVVRRPLVGEGMYAATRGGTQSMIIKRTEMIIPHNHRTPISSDNHLEVRIV